MVYLFCFVVQESIYTAHVEFYQVQIKSIKSFIKLAVLRQSM